MILATHGIVHSGSGPSDLSGRFASFDGADGSKIVCPEAMEFNPVSHRADAITIEFLFRCNTIENLKMVYSQTDLYFTTSFSGQMMHSFRDGATQHLLYSGVSAVAGQWYHAAFRYDGAQADLFIDGVAKASIASAGGINGGVNATDIVIGTYTSATSWAHNGNVAEFRVWNYARTDAQINDNKYKQLPAQTGLTARYPLDYNAFDASGLGKHGTIYGGVTFGGPVSIP